MRQVVIALFVASSAGACDRNNPGYERQADLAGADLAGANLSQPGADLAGTDLGPFNLASADLTGLSVLSVDNATVAEGDVGITTLSFAVHLTPAAAGPVRFTFTTADDTAKVTDGDYLAVAGALTLPSGTTDTTIEVPVQGDLRDEPGETLMLTLGSPTGAVIGHGTATGLITDDDDPPNLTVLDGAGYEGATAGTNGGVLFRVLLDAPSGRAIRVDYATAPGTAAQGRFTAKAGTLTFMPGDTEKDIPVTLVNDNVAEAPQTFTVGLSNAVNVTLVNTQATGTIYDDDSMLPVVTVTAQSMNEGNVGQTDMMFTLSAGLTIATSLGVHVTTVPITAEDGVDYVGVDTDVDLTLGTGTVMVPLIGDAVYETNETFALVLSAPTGVTLSTPIVLGTIVNDDQAPVLALADADDSPGSVGATLLAVPMTITGDTEVEGTAHLATSNQSASSPDDYAQTSGLLRVPAGNATWEAAVPLEGNANAPGGQTFQLNASMPVALQSGIAPATCTIDAN